MFSKVKIINNFQKCSMRYFSISETAYQHQSCRLLVVGGGAGGIAVAAKLNGKVNDIIILEPSEKHYYQPLFTLIGGGIKKFDQSWRHQRDCIPKGTKWIQSAAAKFDPKKNTVVAENGDTIEYDYLVVSLGLELHYEQIPGLVEALSMPEKESMVSSNYSPKYVERTFKCLKEFKSGNLLFTYPNSPVKCPGAPQKCMYIADDYLRKTGRRDKANLIYNSSLAVIFGVKKYADALWKVVEKKDLKVNLRTNLIEIIPDKKKAIFQNLDKPEEKHTFDYSFMNVTPPMGTPKCLKENKDLTNEQGFLCVDKDTLRHTKFPNIFGIGDCTSSPNSKTAAAVGSQSKVVSKNLLAVMDGEKPTLVYNGYASCPLVTSYKTCILAEFDYNLQPLETFPISQDKELYVMYLMKKEFMPALYWHGLLKGYWNGPSAFRKYLNPLAK